MLGKIASFIGAASGLLLTTAVMPTASWGQEQDLTNHWAKAEDCLKAVGAPKYYPTIINKKKLGADEIILGLPQGGCFEMSLPDRLGGRGFVQLDEGRKVIYNMRTKKIVRLEECDNDVYSYFYFASPVAPPGPVGPRGERGEKGDRGAEGPAGRDARDSWWPQTTTTQAASQSQSNSQTVTVNVKSGGGWEKFVIGGVVGGALALVYCNNNRGKCGPLYAVKSGGPGVSSDTAIINQPPRCTTNVPVDSQCRPLTPTTPTGPGVGIRSAASYALSAVRVNPARRSAGLNFNIAFK